MTLYRGPGGTGSATSDADTTLYQDFLNQTIAARDAALQAEINAELAETNAETAETNAETAETNAETAATNAASSASAAASSASSASTSASNASTSASAASTSATNAASSASSASSSASAASTSASNAATSATSASNSASSASTSATSAANSASTATTQATNAASSATAAASSASSSSTSATNAANSASSASTSATNAANSATSAASSASSASTSATNAAASATSASGSASTATTQATNAASSATAAASSASSASTSATNAANSASSASTSATNAASSATAAQSAQSAAEAARDAALSAYDNFDDRYLGPKASDPTLDNDGNALLTGALYFNTATNVMKVYDGSTWVAAYVSAAGVLLAVNNLSDLTNTATARSNLNVPTRTGGDASGTWGINVTGNAGTVTNGVYTTGDQTIAGTKTFSSNPILSAGTVNGLAFLNASKVLTTGSALTFDGSNFGVGIAPVSGYKASINGDIWQGNTGGVIIGSIINNAGWYEIAGSANVNGLQFNHQGTQRWMINGSEQMRLTSTGLGIGTSSPGVRLHVASSGSEVSRFATTGADMYLRFVNNFDTNGYIGYQNAAMTFWTANNLRATLDSSGNLGLGVTPSAWGANNPAIQMGGTNQSSYVGTFATTFGTNAYFDGSGWRYIQTGGASALYNQPYAGGHRWFTAPSGTAGNAISFTQAMTLSNSGNNTALVLQNPAASQTTTFSTSDLYYDFSAAGAVVWRNRTGNAESARIDSSGNLLVGTTGTIVTNYQSRFGVMATTFNGNQGFIGIGTILSTSVDLMQFINPNGLVGRITTNGSATSYVTSSDYRLKEDVQPMVGALAKVAALKPVTYKWKADGSDGEGFIAHELQAVCPDAVVGEKDAVDAEGNPVYQGIDTSFLVATLTAALQEAVAEINQLKADVAALKGA